MRLRNIPGADDVINSSSYCIEKPEEYKGHWMDAFAKPQPLHIEIGMGKGQFIMEMARQHPDINYIGIEKYTSVLLRAIQKMEEASLDNVLFLCFNAENITDVFDEHEVDRIYLNFSDPWPKDRHAKRRLTSPTYLNRYHTILKEDGHIEFKTDNRDLFDYSVEIVKESIWNLDAVTYDLHKEASMNQGNIMTEYEEKFSSMGNPICKLIINR